MVPFNFLMYCDRMDVEKPQRVPGAFLSVFFRHCETFFRELFFTNWLVVHATMDGKNAKGSPVRQFDPTFWVFSGTVVENTLTL